MSTQYNSTNEVPNEVICKRLEELSNAITQGKESFNSEFTMRIPAECDRDADLVLSEASRRIKTLSGKTHIVWLPNTGVIPECKTALVKFNDGMIGGRVEPKFYDWLLNSQDPITEYAIIEE